YNDSATKLNRAVQQIPASLIAGIGGFTQMPYFEASEGKQDMPGWN
ncbi:MAG: LemA family protein, partial [Tissierellia bacterium]|nr:LemA family protein [Tissierellia bacterium]